MTNFKTLIVALTANAMLAQGAILTLYSGPNCSGNTSSRNVWDNTCATGVMGFQSFEITTAGGGGQLISTYSPDACATDYYTCVGASDLYQCFNSYGDNYSGSNAISSSPECGAV